MLKVLDFLAILFVMFANMLLLHAALSLRIGGGEASAEGSAEEAAAWAIAYIGATTYLAFRVVSMLDEPQRDTRKER